MTTSVSVKEEVTGPEVQESSKGQPPPPPWPFKKPRTPGRRRLGAALGTPPNPGDYPYDTEKRRNAGLSPSRKDFEGDLGITPGSPNPAFLRLSAAQTVRLAYGGAPGSVAGLPAYRGFERKEGSLLPGRGRLSELLQIPGGSCEP